MGIVDAEAAGEIDFEWLPDDIAERIVRRVEEKRLLGPGAAQSFRVEDGVATAQQRQAYREAPPARPRTLHIVQVGGRSLFDDLQLTFEGGHLRYHASLPRARLVGLVMGGLMATVSVIGGISVGALAPVVGAAFVAMGLALFALFNWVAVAGARQQTRAALEKLVAEEVAAARNEARLRVELGGGATLERARAVLAVLAARNVALTEAERARILGAPDESTASRWLANAATATTIGDVLERVRVADESLKSEEETSEEEPSAISARGGGRR